MGVEDEGDGTTGTTLGAPNSSGMTSRPTCESLGARGLAAGLETATMGFTSGVAPSFVIGRERSQADVVLHDPNVSRRHAEVSFDGRSWHIIDLHSTNGTLVNDIDIDECILRDGDLVTVGLVNLEFREN